MRLMIARVRPADVDDHRCVQLLAARQTNSGHVPSAPTDLDDRLAEPELGAVVACGVGEVVGGQHRVVDVAGVPVVERRQLAVGIVGEVGIVDPLRRVEAPDVETGVPLVQLGRVVPLVRDAELVPQRHDDGAVVAGGAEVQVAGPDEPGHAVRVFDAEVTRPVAPAGSRLPRGEHGITRRVAVADDRRRRARRTGTGGRTLVHAHDASALRAPAPAPPTSR